MHEKRRDKHEKYIDLDYSRFSKMAYICKLVTRKPDLLVDIRCRDITTQPIGFVTPHLLHCESCFSTAICCFIHGKNRKEKIRTPTFYCLHLGDALSDFARFIPGLLVERK